MQIINLSRLLLEPEGPNLEFKSKLHDIYHSDPIIKGYQRDEFIRDIISLANNNTATAGEEAFLIFGVEESSNSDTSYKVIGVEGRLPTRSEILDIVNPACDPPIGDIRCDELIMDGSKVFVVTIPPDPYLHATRRKLQTGAKTYYSEYVVFIRHNQSIQIASAKERSALEQIRQVRLNDRRTVPPELLGAFLTGTVGGSLTMRLSEKMMPDTKYAKGIGGIMGMVIFGALGWVFGNASKDIIEIKSNWHHYKQKQKILSGIFLAFFPISFILMFVGNKKNDRRVN